MKMQLFGCFIVKIYPFTNTQMETESINTEESLEIEEWMISDNYWGVEDTTQEKEVSVAEEKEEPLEVENWMVNEAYWGL